MIKGITSKYDFPLMAASAAYGACFVGCIAIEKPFVLLLATILYGSFLVSAIQRKLTLLGAVFLLCIVMYSVMTAALKTKEPRDAPYKMIVNGAKESPFQAAWSQRVAAAPQQKKMRIFDFLFGEKNKEEGRKW